MRATIALAVATALATFLFTPTVAKACEPSDSGVVVDTSAVGSGQDGIQVELQNDQSVAQDEDQTDQGAAQDEDQNDQSGAQDEDQADQSGAQGEMQTDPGESE
jgi:hypothetical protein